MLPMIRCESFWFGFGFFFVPVAPFPSSSPALYPLPSRVTSTSTGNGSCLLYRITVSAVDGLSSVVDGSPGDLCPRENKRETDTERQNKRDSLADADQVRIRHASLHQCDRRRRRRRRPAMRPARRLLSQASPDPLSLSSPSVSSSPRTSGHVVSQCRL